MKFKLYKNKQLPILFLSLQALQEFTESLCKHNPITVYKFVFPFYIECIPLGHVIQFAKVGYDIFFCLQAQLGIFTLVRIVQNVIYNRCSRKK